MFSSKSKDGVAMPLNIGPAPIPPKRTAARTGSVPSIVSADLTVTGTLNTSGDMQIDGILEGDVRSSGLVIGERAWSDLGRGCDDPWTRDWAHQCPQGTAMRDQPCRRRYSDGSVCGRGRRLLRRQLQAL
jgi:hypothetical protein